MKAMIEPEVALRWEDLKVEIDALITRRLQLIPRCPS